MNVVCYQAYSPPWRGLRRRSAYFLSFSAGPLTKREMRLASESEPQWRRPDEA